MTDEAIEAGIALVQALDIDSHRLKYTLFEAARAHAAADGRDARRSMMCAVAALALRQRPQ
ncbi:MAG: hypothetical protein U0670_12335 [Anaerolineae bacterium]